MGHAVPSLTNEGHSFSGVLRTGVFLTRQSSIRLPSRNRSRAEMGASDCSIQETAMTDSVNIRSNPFRTTPNMLTLLRICLMPFLVAAILEAHYALGFGLFIVAGLTDALDGTLARLLKQRTMLGQYLRSEERRVGKECRSRW